jgi:hypothetical protein
MHLDCGHYVDHDTPVDINEDVGLGFNGPGCDDSDINPEVQDDTISYRVHEVAEFVPYV